MLRLIVSSAAFIAFSTLSGASFAQEFLGVDSKSVRQIADPKTTQLKEKVVWTRTEKGTELGLLPGVYAATSEIDTGRFYVGKEPSLFMKTVQGQYLVAFGGVWLPVSKERKARFFIVQDDTVRRGATLEEAALSKTDAPYNGPGWLINMLILAATKGSLVLLAEIDDQSVVDHLRAEFGVQE